MRHGETVDNAAHIMQGQTQGQLNDKGFKQAEELRVKLTGIHFDAFVSSDLRRSIQTCEVVARARNALVVTTPLLRERDWGEFTGKYIPDLQDVPEWPSNIESLEALKARARDFISWLKETYPDRVVLAVGHGIINKAIQSVYHKKPMNEIPRMANGEVRILVL